jgi:predicted DsbA family dithiol-disulfide isomerase
MKIIVYIDYVCPYCLLAESVISDAIANEAAVIDWRPFELRPEPVPTLRVEDPYLPAVWQRSVYPLAAKLDVPIQLPSTSPQPRSTKAFELFCLAADHGVGDAYNHAVFEAFFQKDLDIGDPEILANIADSVGLDRSEALAALADRRYAARHRAALDEANEQGVQAVPTIIIGQHVIRGVPSPGVMATALRSTKVTSSMRD